MNTNVAMLELADFYTHRFLLADKVDFYVFLCLCIVGGNSSTADFTLRKANFRSFSVTKEHIGRPFTSRKNEFQV